MLAMKKAAALIVTLSLCTPVQAMHLSKKSETVEVKKVRDGDTLELTDGRLARLIGVDCPEIQQDKANKLNAARLKVPYPHYMSYATKARDYLEKKIAGQKVQIKTDSIFKFADHQDPSGRLWVYLFANQNLVNQDMIQQGYCFVQEKYQFKFREKFVRAEKSAKEHKRNLWSE